MTDLNDTWSLSQIRCWGPGRWGRWQARNGHLVPSHGIGLFALAYEIDRLVVAEAWAMPIRFGGPLPCDWEIGEVGQPGTAG